MLRHIKCIFFQSFIFSLQSNYIQQTSNELLLLCLRYKKSMLVFSDLFCLIRIFNVSLLVRTTEPSTEKRQSHFFSLHISLREQNNNNNNVNDILVCYESNNQSCYKINTIFIANTTSNLQEKKHHFTIIIVQRKQRFCLFFLLSKRSSKDATGKTEFFFCICCFRVMFSSKKKLTYQNSATVILEQMAKKSKGHSCLGPFNCKIIIIINITDLLENRCTNYIVTKYL